MLSMARCRSRRGSLVAIPDHVSFSEAAATWMAYGTAWGGLVTISTLTAGQTVLIPAASSSVGLAAIQIANRRHARPIALTRTSAKADALLGHGAAEVVATAEQDVIAEVKRLTDDQGAHLVFDPVGGFAFPQLARATANGGTLIFMARESDAVVAYQLRSRFRACPIARSP